MYYHFGGQEFKGGLLGLEFSGFSWAAFLSVNSSGETIPLTFPVPRSCLHSFTYVLFIHLQLAVAHRVFLILHHSDSSISVFHI